VSLAAARVSRGTPDLGRDRRAQRRRLRRDTFAIDWYRSDRKRRPRAGGGRRPSDRRPVPRRRRHGALDDAGVRERHDRRMGELGGGRCRWARVETNESDNASGPCEIGWLAPVEPGWPARGRRLLHLPAPRRPRRDPMTLEVVVGCDGALRAWNASGAPLAGGPSPSCAETRSAPAGGDIAGGPENEVVTACSDGTIYARASDGQPLWAFTGPAADASTPALVDLDSDGKREIVVRTGGYLLVSRETEAPIRAPGLSISDRGSSARRSRRRRRRRQRRDRHRSVGTIAFRHRTCIS